MVLVLTKPYMIFLALFYGILFLIIGYIIKFFQDQKQTRFEEEFYYKFKKFNLLSTKTDRQINKKPKLLLFNSKDILVHPNISAALQEIFDFILVKYINSWYQGFSNNEDFIVEIKLFFHILSSEILVRLSKIDTVALVTDKVLPAVVNHLDICYKVMESYNGDANSSSPIQDFLIQRMKSHFHVVMINRNEELMYLRCVSKHIIPLITPDYLHQTENKIGFYLLRECLVGTILLPTMDTIASPDIINSLICLLSQSSSPSAAPYVETSVEPVPILHRYQLAWINRLKSQKTHPKGIECLSNSKNLYHFLQFIKAIEAVPPINFYLLMNSITNKLLNPELSEADKSQLWDDLKRLDQLIKSVDAYSDLNITIDLHVLVLEVIAKGPESVTQLINSEIWMETYNSICWHTETVYLTQYFESDVYLSTIYGNRESECSLGPSDDKEFSKKKLSSVYKNALHFSREDSSDPFSLDQDVTDNPNDPDFSGSLWSDKMFFSCNNHELPDLSTMRVKIPSISQPNIAKFKNDFYFTVHTFKIDSEDLLCKVHRKYGEFYVLEQKLMEFHGNVGRSLPPKKPWDIKKLDFLDSCKCEFETYLLFLVNRPFLKNSQLLYRFLTIHSEFNANTPIEVNLGRFVKSVPMKLAKEKGQFLEQFLINFHGSCDGNPSSKGPDAGNNIISKTAYEPVIKSMIDSRIHAKMFWNNACLLNMSAEVLVSQVCTFTNRFIFSFYDTACHIFETVTQKMSPLHLLLSGALRLRPLIFKFVESLVTGSIKSGVEKICHERLAVDIIHVIRDSVLITGYTRTNAERSEKREQALMYIQKLFPEWLSIFVSSSDYDDIKGNIDRIFDCLQQPKLNKQLSYVLFDIVVSELFPELAENLSDLSKSTPSQT